MRTLILVRSLIKNTMLVTASPLLILVRVVLLLAVYPLWKLLEVTNRPYQEAMEETHRLLSL